jgi:hypothetical protein
MNSNELKGSLFGMILGMGKAIMATSMITLSSVAATFFLGMVGAIGGYIATTIIKAIRKRLANGNESN